EAIELATALLEAQPKKARGSIAEEAARMTVARDRAARARAASRSKSSELHAAHRDTSVDARAFDVAMDRAWATAVRRIQDYAELPVDLYPAAVDAAKVYAIVEDLSILKLNYLAEFAQIGARLDSLKREGLLDDARRFAGGPFVDEVLRRHAEYGLALGAADDATERAHDGDRGEARLELVEAISEYAYQVLAEARPGRVDTWKYVEAALEPILVLRARLADELRAAPPRYEPAPHPPVS
ncbi:MAG TPA: hypothetical protein VL400_20430, partial [Polyangiaceae bacterium]|nr:hypothetical protein [Polyangiaceae bacterium]